MIEMRYLLPQNEVLEQGRTESSRLKRVLIAGKGYALIGGE